MMSVSTFTARIRPDGLEEKMRIHCRTALALFAGVLAVAQAGPVAAQDQVLRAIPVSGSAGPLIDPDAAYWKDAPATKVRMLPQVITKPQNADPAVKELVVRAVHNGQSSRGRNADKLQA
jgi:hypothetical protein